MRPERETPVTLPRKRLWVLALAPTALIFWLYAGINPDFAEWYAIKGYRPISLFMNTITGKIPFSLGEIALIIFILICIGLIVRFVYRMIKSREKGKVLLSFLLNLLCTVSVMVFLFILLSGMNYRRRPFIYNEYPAITVERKYSVDELEELCVYLAENVSLAREQVAQKSGVAVLSGTFEEKSDAVADAYRTLTERYETLTDGYSRVKPVFFSVFMSAAQITGVYSPFTAEANINNEIPGYSIPFTMAHEMAHLQGYMREEEANYLAYLACMTSEDPDLVYSGYFTAYIYASNSLYAADMEAYSRAREKLSDGVKSDLKAHSDYWKRFDTPVADISDKVNDTYLKVNGQSGGTKSYGRVTELLLFHYFTEIKSN